MTLYVDVLFAINFSMDFFSLFITQKILHRKIYKGRMLISAIIGGLYGVFEVLAPTRIIIGSILSVMISFIMCFLTFKEKKLGRFTAMLLLFWGVSASLGGIMSLLYNYLNNILFEYIKEYSYSTIYDGARFFIIASITMIFSMVISQIFNSKNATKEANLEICINYNTFHLKGLCDSGNLLSEPITGKSVILVSKNSKIGSVISNEPEFQKRYIPYQGIEKRGIIKGIVPQKVMVNNNEMSAIVAPIDNINFNGYDALVPISLL